MTVENTSFSGQRAPCGGIVDGERHVDRDEDCLLTDDYSYACGCRQTRHEYHDGSFSQLVIHHDGTVLVDEFLSAD